MLKSRWRIYHSISKPSCIIVLVSNPHETQLSFFNSLKFDFLELIVPKLILSLSWLLVIRLKGCKSYLIDLLFHWFIDLLFDFILALDIWTTFMTTIFGYPIDYTLWTWTCLLLPDFVLPNLSPDLCLHRTCHLILSPNLSPDFVYTDFVVYLIMPCKEKKDEDWKSTWKTLI